MAFAVPHAQITVLDLGCDKPDETAGSEWMRKFTARGQFGYLMSAAKLLYKRLGGPVLIRNHQRLGP